MNTDPPASDPPASNLRASDLCTCGHFRRFHSDGAIPSCDGYADECPCKKFVPVSMCTGPSYHGDDLAEVFRQATARCGAPATHESIMGPRCDACFAELEESRRDSRSLGSLLASWVKKRS